MDYWEGVCGGGGGVKGMLTPSQIIGGLPPLPSSYAYGEGCINSVPEVH